MTNERVIWAGFVIFLAAACANPRGAGPAPAESAQVEPAKTVEIRIGDELVKVEHPGMSLADAIRAARVGRDGFTPVAAGVDDEDPAGARFDVALLSHGRVQEISVDAATGKLTVNEERPVREGQEGRAAKIENRLPAAKIDLSRALEIGLSRAEGARLLGVQADFDGDRLVYSVTVISGEEAMLIAVDSESGDVLRTEPMAGMEGDEQDETPSMTGEVMIQQQDEAAMGDEATPLGEDFEDVPTGELPDGWKVDATGTQTALATWAVVPDATAPSKGHALALTSANHGSASTFNLCWSDEIRFQDGAIEASMKPMSGKEDEGGGLIWRVKDRDDYYVCCANPLEGNFRVYYLQNGFRHELASADAEISAGAWHRIRVEQEGEHITCSLDGKKLLETIDSTFPDEGGVGFWTKADAVTSFDDLLVTSSKDGRGSDEEGDEAGEEMDGDDR